MLYQTISSSFVSTAFIQRQIRFSSVTLQQPTIYRNSYHHRSLQTMVQKLSESFIPLASTKTSSTTTTTTTTTCNSRRSFSSHISFRPWKYGPAVECNGDYRNELWIEDDIGGPLYQYQKSLPRLPVPIDVVTTMERLVPTALPLARSDEEASKFMRAVREFPEQASSLHSKLVHRAQNEFPNSSWLQLWWNQLGYLQVRDSIVINVSYFFHFQDDATIATMEESAAGEKNYGRNVKRAATAITALSEFRKLVCTGQLPAEKIGKNKDTPLCSTAYKYMFHATRIPHSFQDTVMIYDPSLYNHCVVVRKGIYYTMDFCCQSSGKPYSLETLQQGLQQILETADQDDANHHDVLLKRLGYFTGLNRDHWATARQELMEHGGYDMIQALEVLQSSAFVLCLDDTEPKSRSECAEMLLHGNISNDAAATQGYNRWFDKSIQIIVANNGKCGFMGEHSMMDGMPLVNLANTITSTTYQQVYEANRNIVPDANETCNVRRVFQPSVLARLESNHHIQDLHQQATKEFEELVSQNALTVQNFQGYGSTFMKQAGFSPDAYVQMVMQLATYRLFGEQVGTYESTQVRPFLHGRTETTRTVSMESHAFVERYGNRPLNDECNNPLVRIEKMQLFRDAVKAHVTYINLAAQGQGVDRHLLGLFLLVDETTTTTTTQTPDLFHDPLYQRSKRWRVSTSHLTHPNFDGWGYGQVVPDGVGLAYSIHPRHCVFNITALKHTGWTEKLSQLLEEAMMEIKFIIELDSQEDEVMKTSPNSSRSKL